MTATTEEKIRNTTTTTQTPTMIRDTTPSPTPIAEMVKRKSTFPSMNHHALLIHLMLISLRTCCTGYDNTNPMYYEAMREKFQRGKFLKHILSLKRLRENENK